MSALSTHHKRTKRSETKEEQRSTKEKNSSKWQKKLRKARAVTYSSKDRSPKTRATARRNRSKAKTWLLKDRGNARRSHVRSRGKTRKTRSQEQSRNSPNKVFPSHKCNSPKMMHSQKPCAQQVFQKSNKSPPCSITSFKILPLVGTCTHQAYKDLKLPLK